MFYLPVAGKKCGKECVENGEVRFGDTKNRTVLRSRHASRYIQFLVCSFKKIHLITTSATDWTCVSKHHDKAYVMSGLTH